MKRALIALALICAAGSFFPDNASAASVAAGSKCPKIGISIATPTAKYKCVKTGKKIIWQKIPTAKPQTVSKQTPTSSTSLEPTPSQATVKPMPAPSTSPTTAPTSAPSQATVKPMPAPSTSPSSAPSQATVKPTPAPSQTPAASTSPGEAQSASPAPTTTEASVFPSQPGYSCEVNGEITNWGNGKIICAYHLWNIVS